MGIIINLYDTLIFCSYFDALRYKFFVASRGLTREEGTHILKVLP